MPSISDVLNTLTPSWRERLADDRGVTARGLARSYKGEWVNLMKDLTGPELARALRLLEEEDLRVVALRAFDGRTVSLTDIEQTPEGIIKKLCHKAPQQLRQNTWANVYAKMLRDLGWESDKIPAGLEDSIKLQRVFR